MPSAESSSGSISVAMSAWGTVMVCLISLRLFSGFTLLLLSLFLLIEPEHVKRIRYAAPMAVLLHRSGSARHLGSRRIPAPYTPGTDAFLSQA
jgi:hypothetical protein